MALSGYNYHEFVTVCTICMTKLAQGFVILRLPGDAHGDDHDDGVR